MSLNNKQKSLCQLTST